MLMISPEHDLLMPYFKRVCEAYPDAKSVVLPDCGIYALDNRPELIAKKLKAFLAEVEVR